MPIELQVKLLKILEEKSLRRLGGLRSKQVDVRIIAATNSQLEEAVKTGTFRADLFYRLKVLTLELPPLRDRPEDILPLARHYLDRFSRQYRRPMRFRPDAETRLLQYGWPGNVRELANLLERLVLLHDGEEVRAEDLGIGAPAQSAAGVADVDASGIRVDFSHGGVSLAGIERTLIEEALSFTKNNRRRAAELLDISLETLRYRLEKYKIEGA
jgi:two-component system, NtrC family, response regulator AtoC